MVCATARTHARTQVVKLAEQVAALQRRQQQQGVSNTAALLAAAASTGLGQDLIHEVIAKHNLEGGPSTAGLGAGALRLAAEQQARCGNGAVEGG
jgi:hypothetical protein